MKKVAPPGRRASSQRRKFDAGDQKEAVTVVPVEAIVASESTVQLKPFTDQNSAPQRRSDPTTVEATPAAAAPPSADVESVKRQIESIYAKYNPEKLSDLPYLLSKYQGFEVQMLEKLRARYEPQLLQEALLPAQVLEAQHTHQSPESESTPVERETQPEHRYTLMQSSVNPAEVEVEVEDSTETEAEGAGLDGLPADEDRAAALEAEKAQLLAEQIEAEQQALQQRQNERNKFLQSSEGFVDTFTREMHNEHKRRDSLKGKDLVVDAVQEASRSFVAPAAVDRRARDATDTSISEGYYSVDVTKEPMAEIVEAEEAVQELSQAQTRDEETKVLLEDSPFWQDRGDTRAFASLTAKLFSEPDSDHILVPSVSSDISMQNGAQESSSALSKPTRIALLDKKGPKSLLSYPDPQPVQQVVIASVTPQYIHETDSKQPDAILPQVEEIRRISVDEAISAAATSREAWMACQEDLLRKRTDFHGAVTYGFDGVFSWQMYGTAQAMDQDGRPYTEYLMRCQWAPTFDSLRPWMVARRYREFDLLDEQHTVLISRKLRDSFPEMRSYLPKLPKKELFGKLAIDVVSKRQKNLEQYMSHIINTLPVILRSTIMDRFLHVTERIASIKTDIEREGGLPLPPSLTSPERDAASAGRDLSLLPDNDIMTGEEAQKLYDSANAPPLTEYELGVLEESVRDVRTTMLLNTSNMIATDERLRSRVAYCQQQWPSLKRTADFADNPNLALVPRALQVDEELERAMADFKSILTVYKLQGGRL